jgi:hypothetical protein
MGTCLSSLCESNCFVDKKCKPKLFAEGAFENLYDEAYRVLRAEDEKNNIKHLIFVQGVLKK